MKVLYFGFYNPEYPRNHVLIDGLRHNGVEIIECNEWDVSMWRYPKLVWKYLKMRPKHDAMIVGFPGQEAMFLAKFLTRKPIIFDIFTSHFMGYILDRKYFSSQSFRAKYYRFLDRWSCKLADVVILDTQAHINFFVREFGLDHKKFKRIWLGANPDLHRPREVLKNNDLFSVLFWGNFIPLQGAEVIVKTAEILRNEPIIFNLIGRGQTQEPNKNLARDLGLTKVNFLGHLPDQALIEYISKSDVCLGVFSSGQKADITIQNKIFESMASKKPIITVKTTALRELLNDGQGVLLCEKNNPEDLAAKILMLKNNPELKNKIAEEGYKLFLEKLTPKKIGQDLVKIVAEFKK